MSHIWVWMLIGVAWWLVALATLVPFRARHRRVLAWVRPTLGLPVVVAGWVEMRRARRTGFFGTRRSGLSGTRRSGLSGARHPGLSGAGAARRWNLTRPYRGFRPLWLSLVIAEVICVGIGLIVAAL